MREERGRARSFACLILTAFPDVPSMLSPTWEVWDIDPPDLGRKAAGRSSFDKSLNSRSLATIPASPFILKPTSRELSGLRRRSIGTAYEVRDGLLQRRRCR